LKRVKIRIKARVIPAPSPPKLMGFDSKN